MTIEITSKPTISIYENVLVIPIKSRQQAFKALNDYKDDKTYVCEIKQKKERRSLNANAYCWLLIGEIAEKLNLPNDAVYEMMIQRYSKAYTHIIVKPEAAEQTKATLRAAHIYAYEIGDIEVNSKDGIQLQLFWGSSTFDTKQMARLIDGVVSEAKELGIETATPAEIARYKEEWHG
jgi:hypothetical protein